MIAYLDSSVLVRAYLSDEEGHVDAVGLLDDVSLAAVTGTWSRIEVSGAVVRAARNGRADEQAVLDQIDADLGPAGRVTVLSAPQEAIEAQALTLVRDRGLRAMDAWHLALARLALPELASPNEPLAFASRDTAQAAVARDLGFEAV